jgi:hypothetical protein
MARAALGATYLLRGKGSSPGRLPVAVSQFKMAAWRPPPISPRFSSAIRHVICPRSQIATSKAGSLEESTKARSPIVQLLAKAFA